MKRYYLIVNTKGEYLSHKGERWTRKLKLAHIMDSLKTPREKWLTEKCFGETVTTEDW